MNDRFLLIALFLGILLAGCIGEGTNFGQSGNQPETSAGTLAASLQNSTGAAAPDLVEVIHFHGTHQCYSCIMVGDLAEKTINTYFSKEVAEGKISFAHINGELTENQGKVAKYGATGSSLWIGTYSDGKFYKEQNINVWYKINDEAGYMIDLKGVLEKKLQGA